MKRVVALTPAQLAAMPRVAPSKPDYWSGTDANDGTGYTLEQLSALKTLRSKAMSNRRRFDLPEQYVVIREAGINSLSRLPITVATPCPVTSCTRDRTQICVIAPNGMETWVVWQ